MKKWYGLLILLILCLTFSQVNAKLLGLEPIVGSSFPDINFDNTGIIEYDSGSNKFELTADDLKYAYSLTKSDFISGDDGVAKIKIELIIDENGDLVSGTMKEYVDWGMVTIGDNTYNQSDILLQGQVTAFGWGEGTGGEALGDFDFLVDIDGDVSKLVSDNLWPDSIPTGIVADAESIGTWNGNWNEDFSMSKVKGDKAPVPEPGTLWLIGTGLVGLGIFLRRRN